VSGRRGRRGALTTSPGSLPLKAVVLLLGTVLTFSVYTVLVRRHSAGIGAAAVATLSHIGALAVLAPLAVADFAGGDAVRPGADLGTAAAIVYAGAGTALAYLLFSYAVARRPSARFAVSLYAVPPLGVLAAFVVLGERPHGRDIVGGALILTAVWLGERAR
jgi:O-acetylserine/cysteine efflux transporter